MMIFDDDAYGKNEAGIERGAEEWTSEDHHRSILNTTDDLCSLTTLLSQYGIAEILGAIAVYCDKAVDRMGRMDWSSDLVRDYATSTHRRWSSHIKTMLDPEKQTVRGAAA